MTLLALDEIWGAAPFRFRDRRLARLLLMASLMKFGSLPPAADPDHPTAEERVGTSERVAAYQTVFNTHRSPYADRSRHPHRTQSSGKIGGRAVRAFGLQARRRLTRHARQMRTRRSEWIASPF